MHYFLVSWRLEGFCLPAGNDRLCLTTPASLCKVAFADAIWTVSSLRSRHDSRQQAKHLQCVMELSLATHHSLPCAYQEADNGNRYLRLVSESSTPLSGCFNRGYALTCCATILPQSNISWRGRLQESVGLILVGTRFEMTPHQHACLVHFK
jgi:hypothetical protein